MPNTTVQFIPLGHVIHDETNKPWYDTKLGIQGALSTLESFAVLVSARHTAGYVRHERLNEFYVLGRYSLDSCGNLNKFVGWIPKVALSKLPDVFSHAEFWEYLKSHRTFTGEEILNEEIGYTLPTNGVICPVCKKGWDIRNCHDALKTTSTEIISLDSFVGQRLSSVMQFYQQKNDGHYFLADDFTIRNNRYIDLLPKFQEEYSQFKDVTPKNEKGWLSKSTGITSDYIIQYGDESLFHIWKYFHKSCSRLNMAMTEETTFRELFKKAGFSFVVLHHIENSYRSGNMSPPWFRAETEIGSITIGWRTRVIHIDWRDTSYKEKNILFLFRNEEVTKGGTFIHAWGKDKAVEYLRKIREALST